MHTTRISNQWSAIHHEDINDRDEIIFMFKESEDDEAIEIRAMEIVIPYFVVKTFVAEQIRKKKIESIEKATLEDILNL